MKQTPGRSPGQLRVVTWDSVSKPSVKKMGAGLLKITDIPGVLAYGTTKDEAKANAYAIALRVIADQVENLRSSSRGPCPRDLAFLNSMKDPGKTQGPSPLKRLGMTPFSL